MSNFTNDDGMMSMVDILSRRIQMIQQQQQMMMMMMTQKQFSPMLLPPVPIQDPFMSMQSTFGVVGSLPQMPAQFQNPFAQSIPSVSASASFEQQQPKIEQPKIEQPVKVSKIVEKPKIVESVWSRAGVSKVIAPPTENDFVPLPVVKPNEKVIVKEEEKTMERTSNTSDNSGYCVHRPVTRYLIAAALITHFDEDIDRIEFENYTLKFNCGECQRKVYLNVVFIGECFRTGKLHLEFHKSTQATQREEVIDFTHVGVDRKLIDKVFNWMNDEPKRVGTNKKNSNIEQNRETPKSDDFPPLGK